MKNSKVAIALVAGTLIGAAAGLLIAPRAGKESRQIVTSKAGSLQKSARGYLTSFRKRQSGPAVVEEGANSHVSEAIS